MDGAAATSHMSGDIADALFERHVHDGLLSSWKDIEKRVYVAKPQSPDAQQLHCRGLAIQFVDTCVGALRLPEWLAARTIDLFDMYFVRTIRASVNRWQVSQVPLLCVALLRLVCKVDLHELQRIDPLEVGRDLRKLNEMKAEVPKWRLLGPTDSKNILFVKKLVRGFLGRPDNLDETKMLQQICNHERAVLVTLDWKVHILSADAWFMAFWSRLEVIQAKSSCSFLNGDALMREGWKRVAVARRHFPPGIMPPRSVALAAFAIPLSRQGQFSETLKRIMLQAAMSSADEGGHACTQFMALKNDIIGHGQGEGIVAPVQLEEEPIHYAEI